MEDSKNSSDGYESYSDCDPDYVSDSEYNPIEYNKVLKSKLGSFKDWEYVGNNKNQQGIDIWKLQFDYNDMPKLVYKCVCNHVIDGNYWIKNKITGEIKTLGNQCYKLFVPEEKRFRRCADCGNLNTDSKSRFCNTCRKNHNESDGVIEDKCIHCNGKLLHISELENKTCLKCVKIINKGCVLCGGKKYTIKPYCDKCSPHCGSFTLSSEYKCGCGFKKCDVCSEWNNNWCKTHYIKCVNCSYYVRDNRIKKERCSDCYKKIENFILCEICRRYIPQYPCIDCSTIHVNMLKPCIVSKCKNKRYGMNKYCKYHMYDSLNRIKMDCDLCKSRHISSKICVHGCCNVRCLACRWKRSDNKYKEIYECDILGYYAKCGINDNGRWAYYEITKNGSTKTKWIMSKSKGNWDKKEFKTLTMLITREISGVYTKVQDDYYGPVVIQ